VSVQEAAVSLLQKVLFYVGIDWAAETHAVFAAGGIRPVGVAESQLSPCPVTKLPTMPALGDRRRSPAKPSGRPGLARLVVALTTPTNHRRAHPSTHRQ